MQGRMRFFRKPLGGIDLGLQDAILVVRSKIMIINSVHPARCIEKDRCGPFTSCWLLGKVVVVCLQAFESFELLLRKLTRSLD